MRSRRSDRLGVSHASISGFRAQLVREGAGCFPNPSIYHQFPCCKPLPLVEIRTLGAMMEQQIEGTISVGLLSSATAFTPVHVRADSAGRLGAPVFGNETKESHIAIPSTVPQDTEAPIHDCSHPTSQVQRHALVNAEHPMLLQPASAATSFSFFSSPLVLEISPSW